MATREKECSLIKDQDPFGHHPGLGQRKTKGYRQGHGRKCRRRSKEEQGHASPFCSKDKRGQSGPGFGGNLVRIFSHTKGKGLQQHFMLQKLDLGRVNAR